MAKSNVSMKLLIDTRGKQVLFAEASKDCVDFLFYLLSLPVATVIRLLGAEGMEGSLPILYNSLENLNDTYIQPNQKKDTYLKPAVSVSSASLPLLAFEGSSTENNSYRCNNCGSGYVPSYHQRKCSNCYHNLSLDDSGLVKGVVTYMVMDNLEVKPMSTISSIALLNDFKVKEVGALEEKVVKLGMKEAIKLLKTSLTSKNVLTDLFC